MIGKNIREYEIIKEIGEGGMGTVYLAEHSILGKFAIKALAPQLLRNHQFRSRFITEAKAQFALKHDNIVQLHTFMEEGDNLFLVMEYIDGDPLDVFIEKKKKIPEKDALLIFKNVLSGLNYAHSKGIIHRDIKPSNILLTSSGTAKIMDFGIALMASGKRLTKTGTAMGTSWYMSPEQIAKPKEIDHRSDVYSIGIILYEMLSGQVPFDGDTDYEIYQKHINAPLPDITSISKKISPTLAGIIHKTLEKNPDDRFDGCGEVIHYIEAYENGDEAISVKTETQKKIKPVNSKNSKEKKNSGNAIILSWELFTILLCIIIHLNLDIISLKFISIFIYMLLSGIFLFIKFKERINQFALIGFWGFMSVNVMFYFSFLFDYMHIKWFNCNELESGLFFGVLCSFITGIILNIKEQKHFTFLSMGFFLYIVIMVINLLFMNYALNKNYNF